MDLITYFMMDTAYTSRVLFATFQKRFQLLLHFWEKGVPSSFIDTPSELTNTPTAHLLVSVYPFTDLSVTAMQASCSVFEQLVIGVQCLTRGRL